MVSTHDNCSSAHTNFKIMLIITLMITINRHHEKKQFLTINNSGGDTFILWGRRTMTPQNIFYLKSSLVVLILVFNFDKQIGNLY